MQKNNFLESSYPWQLAFFSILGSLIPFKSCLALPSNIKSSDNILINSNVDFAKYNKNLQKNLVEIYPDLQELFIRNLDLSFSESDPNELLFPEYINNDLIDISQELEVVDDVEDTKVKALSSYEYNYNNLVYADIENINNIDGEYTTFDFYGDDLINIAINTETIQDIELYPTNNPQRVALQNSSASHLINQVVNIGDIKPASHAYYREDGAIVLTHQVTYEQQTNSNDLAPENHPIFEEIEVTANGEFANDSLEGISENGIIFQDHQNNSQEIAEIKNIVLIMDEMQQEITLHKPDKNINMNVQNIVFNDLIIYRYSQFIDHDSISWFDL